MRITVHKFFLFASLALLLQGSSAKAQVVTTLATVGTSPASIVVGALDTLYVFSEATNNIVKIDPTGTVTAFVGDGTYGSTDGTGSGASFANIYGMVRDASGNIFATSFGSNTIRKITPAGVVTTFITGLSAPVGIVFGKDDTLIVYNRGSGEIVKIAPSGTIVSFTTAAVGSWGLAKGSNDTLYLGGYGNNRVYKIDPLGTVTVLAGSGSIGNADGTGVAATFYFPINITVDGAGDVYVADYFNNLVRKVTPGGVVTTIAGDGTAASTDGIGTAAQFNRPVPITISPSTGNFFIGDYNATLVRMMTGGVPLPLSWLALSANLSSKGNAQIQWEVNETAVKHYCLQKSIDGSQYMSIGNINSKGNGAQKYSYTEPSTLSGTAYYRIQQVDMDGKSTFSASLKLNNTASAAQGIKVYPTQVLAGFTISSTTAQHAQLINNLGQVVQVIDIVAGEQQVSMAGQPAGIYYIKSDNGSAQRIVKL